MKYLGLVAGKVASKIGKALNRGSSFPGLLAIKVSPGLFKQISYPKEIIVVTGTNGKTSTANMLADILRSHGKKVVYNGKGANLLSGLLSTLIEETGFDFRVKADVLLLEVDESTVPLFFKSVKPTYLVINNFFRDQLDRHGEIDTLVKKIQDAIDPSTKLVLNANDPLVRLIGWNLSENERVYFGVDKTVDSVESIEESREAKWCPHCNKTLKYDFYHYSQLGEYSCDCGFKVPDYDYLATDVDLKNRSFNVDEESYSSSYDNLYFLFNTMGAISVAKELGIGYDTIKDSIADFKIGEGRMEEFTVGKYSTFLNLVKNPSGLNQSLSHILKQEDEKFSVFFALNNLYADGVDTSWIWDVSFEVLKDSGLDKFVCSGFRAYDLAVRLKYAGVDEDKIKVIEGVDDGVGFLVDQVESKPYILSSYTALQSVRKSLNSLNKK